MQSNLKLNASPKLRGGPPWPVGLALLLCVGLVHLWLLAAAPAQLVPTPGPALSASAVLYQPLALPATTAAPAPQTARPAPRQDPGSQPARPGPDSAPATAPAATLTRLPDEGPAAESVVSQGPASRNESTHEAAAEAPPALPGPPAQDPPASAAPPVQGAAESLAPAPSEPDGKSAETAPSAPAAQVALSIPGSARLNYQLTGSARGFEYTASAQLDWQHDGQRYQSRVVISSFPLPSRSQTSVGELGPQGLSPRRFSDRARSEVAIHFQPDLGRIVFSNNSPQAPWQAGTQDRLSVFFQLAALMGGNPARFEPGATISIPTAGLRNVEPWDFTVVRRENLSLPIGEHPALLLRREPRHLYDQTLELWFAPTLGYLPVRIAISQSNGDRVDQRLVSIEKP